MSILFTLVWPLEVTEISACDIEKVADLSLRTHIGLLLIIQLPKTIIFCFSKTTFQASVVSSSRTQICSFQLWETGFKRKRTAIGTPGETKFLGIYSSFVRTFAKERIEKPISHSSSMARRYITKISVALDFSQTLLLPAARYQILGNRLFWCFTPLR